MLDCDSSALIRGPCGEEVTTGRLCSSARNRPLYNMWTQKVRRHRAVHKGVHMALIETSGDELIPHCVAGEITGRALHPRDFYEGAQLRAGLSGFGLHPPGAPTERSKAEPRPRGHAVIHEALPRQGR
jgi:hypothetical protein